MKSLIGTSPSETFTSRFELIRSSADRIVYPTESIGMRSAQYLGERSRDPHASLSFSRDGYVVESED